ncbi:PREDICTED: uncharacterized protein LOC108779734 [Cyphomyrmex costatus]|uniref:uncharacterized protein LOC108779734 n=1 Tax=Cyphomyrmex costatus TaxID=456900 RepID=UPI000852341A|nr:PREDICTED: uncharacterized protein LOC108779734 [Cyphomyrmex costatus]
MFGLPLELQILSVNILGLVSITLNWNLFKWDQQLEKISNVSVSQSDELDVKNIDWLKTILSWIVIARFIIDRISPLAYMANIYTVVTRSRQNLLKFWMATKKSFPTSLLVEFVVDKTIFLVISTGKLWTTLKWYMQLRRVTKIRRFTIIARRSIANITNVPGRIGRSLDDECLGIAIIRRGKYASLLNLGRLSEESSSRTTTKSLTTLVTDDTNGTNGTNGANNYNSDDLSVAEKSMRMLNVTAEDVMDARARIQERSYWDEQDAIAKIPEVIEEVIKQLPLEKNEEKIINATKNTQLTEDNLKKTVNNTLRKKDIIKNLPVKKEKETSNKETILVDKKEQILTGSQEEVIMQLPSKKNEEEIINVARNTQLMEDNLEKIVSRILRKKDITEYLPVKKEKEEGNKETILLDEKEQILTENQEDVSLEIKNVASDKVNHAKSTGSHDIYVTSKKKRKEKKEGVEKIVQCPSFQSMNARNTEAKPCASLVRKLKAKLCPVLINQEKWIDRVDREGYPYEVNTQLTPTSSSASKKERHKISNISCGCHRALRKNRKHVQSIGSDGKNIEYDINRKEFKSFRPIVNMQRSRIDKSTFKYSEAYRLKKQIQKWEEYRGKHSWGSKSLAETARSSGYAKNVFNTSDKLSVINCRKNVQTDTCDESMMMSDSLSERHRLKYSQKRSKRPVNLRPVYNVTSFRENSETCKTKMKALEINNNFTLENNTETEARKKCDLLLANRKLSIEQREAIELKALKAYNELTLSEDKRELEVRKDRDLSLNYGRSAKESEVPEMKVLKTYNDSLLEDKKEMERTRRHNLSPSSQQSIDERCIPRVRNELERSGSKRELQTRRKRDSSRDETPSECEKIVETPASVSNRLSIGSWESTMISTHQNVNSNFSLNDRYARQAHMSLNLWEITRNIEWTVHPRGIILTNKNLQGQFLENGRFRENQQRDIVDDNTASMLHSAFFFKPEIITRVFRRDHTQTRIDQFFSRFPTFLRQDFNTEFVCQMNNEVIVRHWNSPFDYDLERMMGNDRNDLREQFNTNDNRNTTSEHDHDLCIIVIGQEQVSNESQTAIEDSTTVETQENTRSSIESTQMTNILVFNENHNRVDNATNDNLPVQLITDVLRNFNIEISEGNIYDDALPIEECEDVSNVNVYNDPQSREFNMDDINLDEENNECDGISSHKNEDIDDTIHKIEQPFNLSDNFLNNMHSDDKLQQDDSFYNRNDDPGTPVSFDDNSLMEEFLNDPVPPLNSS